MCVLIDQSGETPLHLFVNAYVNSLCLLCYERVSCLVRAACPKFMLLLGLFKCVMPLRSVNFALQLGSVS